MSLEKPNRFGYCGTVTPLIMRGWRNWQTHYLEVVAPSRAWRFKSSPAHSKDMKNEAHVPRFFRPKLFLLCRAFSNTRSFD